MTDKTKEALKLALELLDRQWQCKQLWSLEEAQDVADNIREALAEEFWGTEQPAQQEPVVWMYVNKSTHETKFQKHMRDFIDHSLWSEVPLYGEPLANHELQCVCGAVWCGDEMVHLPDKHPQAQRTWVGLTDEDIDIAFDDTQEGGGFDDFARAIEAKLREKNA